MVVTVLCDLGVKYLSKVYNETWLEENLRPDPISLLGALPHGPLNGFQKNVRRPSTIFGDY